MGYLKIDTVTRHARDALFPLSLSLLCTRRQKQCNAGKPHTIEQDKASW